MTSTIDVKIAQLTNVVKRRPYRAWMTKLWNHVTSLTCVSMSCFGYEDNREACRKLPCIMHVCLDAHLCKPSSSITPMLSAVFSRDIQVTAPRSSCRNGIIANRNGV
jgi:hypothetical protein